MNNPDFFILDNVDKLDKLSCHSHDPVVLKLLEYLSKSKHKITLNDIKDDIISGPMGFNLHTIDYVSSELPNSVKLLQISNIDEFGNLIDTKVDKYISEDKKH